MLILLSVATLQQFNHLTSLPGSSSFYINVRPASVTGSYLHYPIILALLTVAFFEIYNTTDSFFHLFLGMAGTFGVFASFSRSGSMIILLSFFFYVFFIKRQKKLIIVLSILLTLAIIIYVIFQTEITQISRILSSIDLSSEGNVDRVKIWNDAIKLWLQSPLLIGNHTGLITNSNTNFEFSDSIIVESGILQQLLSFGLIGVILYYSLFIIMFRRIDIQHKWLKALVIASVFQTFIYQSIEVFPFIVILSLIPPLSDSIKYVRINKRGYSNE